MVLGLAGAFAMARVMKGMLVGVGSTDTTTFAAIVVVFAVVTIAASLVPGHRASRLDDERD